MVVLGVSNGDLMKIHKRFCINQTWWKWEHALISLCKDMPLSIKLTFWKKKIGLTNWDFIICHGNSTMVPIVEIISFADQYGDLVFWARSIVVGVKRLSLFYNGGPFVGHPQWCFIVPMEERLCSFWTISWLISSDICELWIVLLM